MESYEELRKAIQPLNITNPGHTVGEFLPVCYRYDRQLLSPAQPEQYLRLIGSGRIDIQTPFALSIRPVSCLFLLYSLHGRGQLTFGQSVHPVGTGDILLFFCDTPCQLRSTLLPWSFRLFAAAGPQLQDFLPLSGNPCLTARQKNPAMASAIEDLASCPETVSLSSLINTHRILTDLLADACLSGLTDRQSSQANIPSWLHDLHAYIHNCENRTFSLAALEELYGISRYRLCREYSAAFHISPLKDYNQIRMREAKKLLLNTHLQVQEISSRLGYDNTNHFIRLFRAQTGLTPGAYRTSCGK